MPRELGEIMWLRLVANKILRKRYGSNKLLADYPTAGVAGGADSELDVSSLGEPPSFNPKTLLNKDSSLNYKVLVTTWNVGGIAPGEDLELDDLVDPGNPCDIYVFGFQEIVPLTASNVLGSENRKVCMKWNSMIREALNKKVSGGGRLRSASSNKNNNNNNNGAVEQNSNRSFRCIISKQMVGILISVWVRSDLCAYVRNPNVSCIGCGIMGRLGNKGSVSVRFRLHESSFCFVCCHLASGGREGDEKIRNQNVSAILSRTTFPRGPSLDLPRRILDHDRVVFLGDLNYRISLPEETTRLLVDSKDWKFLLANDQLSKELVEGQHFRGWHEGKITFPPTYKYRPNSDVYCGCVHGKKGEKRRAPAWCDRIIWYDSGLRQQFYTRNESKLSDHRPVKAIFAAEVEMSKALQRLHRLFLSDRFAQITGQLQLPIPTSNHFLYRARSSCL